MSNEKRIAVLETEVVRLRKALNTVRKSQVQSIALLGFVDEMGFEDGSTEKAVTKYMTDARMGLIAIDAALAPTKAGK